MSSWVKLSLVVERDYFQEIMSKLPNQMRWLIGKATYFQGKENAVLLYWDRLDHKGSRFYDLGNLLLRGEYHRYYLLSIGEEIEDCAERGGWDKNPFSTKMVRKIEMDLEGGKEIPIKSLI
jgi:hypothetical protein